MKFFLWLLPFLSLTSSFPTKPSQRPPSSNLPSSSSDENNDSSTSFSSSSSEYHSRGGGRRREVLSVISGAVAWAVPAIAQAGLLDDFGTDPTKIQAVVKPAPAATSTAPAKTTGQGGIDPTLKGSYYYPTAKKRYLPRIQKVTEEIVSMPDAIAGGDWLAVTAFGKVAENAVLPLQLYVSSLDGQGLSMANSYAKQMKIDALAYEKAYKLFEKALKKQDGEIVLQTVAAMGVAIIDYRTVGRLRDDDGNLPSVDEMRRMTMRRPVVAAPTTTR